MHGLQINKKRKMTLNKRKKTLFSKRKKYHNLALLIEDDSGKHSTYYIPVKAIVGNSKLTNTKKYKFKQYLKTKNSWQIEDSFENIIIPDALVNKKISLRKGNTSVQGVVLKATPLSKAPEGKPVPLPPPPLDE